MNSQKTSDDTGLIEQYFETNNLSTHPTRKHYILFQMKECRQKVD
jgi:hypothetical protein